MKRKTALLLAYLFFWMILPAWPAHAVPVVKDLIVKNSPWVDVRAYGAVGNGIANDTAVVQAAIDYVESVGGGTVFFPVGTYLFTTISEQTGGGNRWALGVKSDNVSFVGMGPKSILKTTDATAQVIHVSGAGKPAGLTSWMNYRYQDVSVTLYAIDNATVGAGSVTTSTASQAGNFVAGDIVYIRCGQTAANAGSTEPDAEINEVITATAATGVIVLKYPLAKSYVPRNYPDSHPDNTTAAPFGIAKVTDRTIKNFSVRDLRFESEWPAIFGGQLIGFTWMNTTGLIGSYAFQNMGDYRNAFIAFNDFTTNMTESAWGYDTAKGTTDVVFLSNFARGTASVPSFHIHEGSANIKLIGNTLTGVAASVDRYALSIRATGHNIDVIGNTFSVSGSVYALVYIDPYVVGGVPVNGNGKFIGNKLIGSGVSSFGIGIIDTGGWYVDDPIPLSVGNSIADGNTVTGIDRIYVGAEGMYPFGGSPPSLSTIQNFWPSYSAVDNQTTYVGFSTFMPSTWKSFDAYLHWTNLGSGTDNVLFGGGITNSVINGTLPNTSTVNLSSGATATQAQYKHVRTVMKSIPVTGINANIPVNIWVNRSGTDPLDTSTDNVAILGVELLRVK